MNASTRNNPQGVVPQAAAARKPKATKTPTTPTATPPHELERQQNRAAVKALIALVSLRPEFREALEKQLAFIKQSAVGEVLNATYLRLLQKQSEFYSLSPEGREEFVLTAVAKIARAFRYAAEHDFQLFSHENTGASVSIKCGSGMTKGDRDRTVEGGESESGHVLSRADWRLLHQTEDAMIAEIDRKTAIARGELPDPDAEEYEYEYWCRVLGERAADFMLDYEFNLHTKSHTSAERVRYHRLKKKLAGMAGM